MQIKLQFTLPVSDPTGSREAFWQTYRRLSRLVDPDDLLRDADSDDLLHDDDAPDERAYAALMEARLYSNFIPLLNNSTREHLNGPRRGSIDSMERQSPSGDVAYPAPFQQLTLTIIRINYQSLDIWLAVLGLDSDTLLPIVAAVLEVYASEALGSAMPGNSVPMRVSASPVPSAASVKPPPVPTTPKDSAARDAAHRIRTIIRDSILLLPVALALAVTYIAFGAFSEQLKDGRQEHRAILQSSLDFAKLVTEHNTAMARVIQLLAADVTKALKELQQLQLDELRASTTHQNMPPRPARQVPRRN